MILGGTDNIRDVIAFPKNLSAVCPMTMAPGSVDEEQLDDLGLKIVK
jgi:aspartyl-tRNA synthetase